MTRSEIFTAAHAAAKTVRFAALGTYRQRFAAALKQQYAAAKQAAAPSEVKYLLKDAQYFGGNHTAALTFAELVALGGNECDLSLEGGYGPGFVYDYGSLIARVA